MPRPSNSATASHQPRRGRKYFTLAEANRSLPYVSRVVRDVAAAFQAAMAIRQQLEHPEPEDVPAELSARYVQAMDRLNDLVDELKHAGVELKDFEQGLLDFPAVHQGREIYLCWRMGEETVANWHEVDSGFAGRQAAALLENPS